MKYNHKEEHVKSQKTFGFLKKIDLFSVPVKTYFHRHDANLDSVSYHERMGSYMGGSMTILFVIFIVLYSTTLVIQMVHGDQDIINKMVMTNQFDAETRQVNMSEHRFLPYLAMDQQDFGENDTSFDIWVEDQSGKRLLSYNKLKNYIDVYWRSRILGDNDGLNSYDKTIS